MRWLAFLIGILAAGAAMADDGGADPSSLLKFGAPGLIALVVWVARRIEPTLADGSPFAKRMTGLACLLAGITLALLGAAPAMDPGGGVGKVLGGIGAGAMAFLLAGVAGSKARGEGE